MLAPASNPTPSVNHQRRGRDRTSIELGKKQINRLALGVGALDLVHEVGVPVLPPSFGRRARVDLGVIRAHLTHSEAAARRLLPFLPFPPQGQIHHARELERVVSALGQQWNGRGVSERTHFVEGRRAALGEKRLERREVAGGRCLKQAEPEGLGERRGDAVEHRERARHFSPRGADAGRHARAQLHRAHVGHAFGALEATRQREIREWEQRCHCGGFGTRVRLNVALCKQNGRRS